MCEKPLTVNAAETQSLIKLAKEQNLFLMEAMWMRFLPVISQLKAWIKEQIIGEIRMLKADFGIRKPLDSQSRLFNPDLAGGALLDVGIYPISLAFWVFERAPQTMHSAADLGITGIDEQNACIFKYNQGQLAILFSALRTNTSHQAEIYGTRGSIVLPDFWHGQSAIVKKEGKAAKTYHFPIKSNGYNYEAKHVMDCLKNGKMESDVMPLRETLEIISTMDKMRKQWELKYPFE